MLGSDLLHKSWGEGAAAAVRPRSVHAAHTEGTSLTSTNNNKVKHWTQSIGKKEQKIYNT